MKKVRVSRIALVHEVTRKACWRSTGGEVKGRTSRRRSLAELGGPLPRYCGLTHDPPGAAFKEDVVSTFDNY